LKFEIKFNGRKDENHSDLLGIEGKGLYVSYDKQEEYHTFSSQKV
jgi:hypothetical protein